MKILIIGGTGNISTPITKMMQGNGHILPCLITMRSGPTGYCPKLK